MKSKEIIYISSIPWDYAWHRQQEMMSKLADNGYSVLFVQPVNRNMPFKETFEKKADNIWLLTPKGLPYERCLWSVNKINSAISRNAINKFADRIGFREPIIWFDRIHGVDIKYFTTTGFCVYDLVDEVLSFGRWRNEKMLLSCENVVLRKTDLLLSSSNLLLKRKMKQSGRMVPGIFIPNGLNSSRFKNDEVWEPLKQIKKPIIGFVGTIQKRNLNYNIINAITSIHSEYSFVFVGPGSDEDKNELSSLGQNIFVFNAVSGKEIPLVISSFDVGIIPYNNDDPSMDYVFPRKVFEYLASGLPVVCTKMEELSDFSEYVMMAETDTEFAEAIKISVIENNEESALARKQFAAQYDWDNLLLQVTDNLP